MPQAGLEVLTCQEAREEISRRVGGRCGSRARGGVSWWEVWGKGREGKGRRTGVED